MSMVYVHDSLTDIIGAVAAEVDRQEAKYGPFDSSVAGMRLAIAVLHDEAGEALGAWRDERDAPTWDLTHAEVLQVAAVACRLLRDTRVTRNWKELK